VAMELAVSKAIAPPSIGKPRRKTAKVIPHTASNKVGCSIQVLFNTEVEVVSKLKLRHH